MRSKDNKRPSAGKGSAGRGRSAGTGKSAFRDSSSPKRGRTAGKPAFGSHTGKPKDNIDSPFTRRNKPSSAGRDSSASREHNDRPHERKDSIGSPDRGPSKYVRRDKPFSSDRDSSVQRGRDDRPYERRDSTRSGDTGPKKYVRRDKPFSSDRDSSVPRDRSDRPYERKGSTVSEDKGPSKYVYRDKPFAVDRDSAVPRGRGDRPYERKDSAGSEDKGPSKYIHRDKPFTADRDSAPQRDRSDRPYKRHDSGGTEERSPSNYPPRRERPAPEPRQPVLDLREEKLKASGEWKEEISPRSRSYHPKQSGDGTHPEGSAYDNPLSARPGKRAEAESIRLNKFIANAGVCSRREADVLIQAGAIKVNGIVVTELGVRVGPRDKVQYGDQTLAGEKMMYVLLNKPKGYITTSEDPYDRKTVMELVRDACRERIYPVGRLDRNTTGLLLLTNDGDLAKKLTHPRHKVKKIYHVELDKALTKSDMIRITDGIELEDGVVKADEIAYTGESKREIGIELHSGKNRVVRRIFEVLEYDVVKLDRVSFAGLTKKDLPRSRWRFLTDREVNYLKMLR